MELHDAVELIRFNAGKAPVKWADLGCGGGLFTRALAHLLTPGSTIFAIDKSKPAFNFLGDENGITLIKQTADFVDDDLNLPLLDGILLANSFHYVKNKHLLLQKLLAHLKPSGCMLFVEYDTDIANQWVPYPVKASALQSLLSYSGFSSSQKLHHRPSAFGHANLYSVMACR